MNTTYTVKHIQMGLFMKFIIQKGPTLFAKGDYGIIVPT